MKENILVGKTIQSIKIADDKLALNFITDAGEVVVNVDADCCSYTWVEHVELPALGFPAVVISADDLEMPDLGDQEGCDVVRYYGFKIITDKGEIIIDYRNDSNGYYGGNLSWPDDSYHYGGVYGQANSKHNWVELNKDI
jgi:hypothetical protein